MVRKQLASEPPSVGRNHARPLDSEHTGIPTISDLFHNKLVFYFVIKSEKSFKSNENVENNIAVVKPLH